MLWDCPKGDCYQIAESLESCPVCGQARPERNPPDLTAAGPQPASPESSGSSGSPGEAPGAPRPVPAPPKKPRAAGQTAADQILEGFDAPDHT